METESRVSVIAMLSSGLDSTVSAHVARSQGQQIRLAVHFDYGQKAARSERTRFEQLCRELEVPGKVIELPWFADFQTALHQEKLALPTPRFRDLDAPLASQASARAVWVPNRNALFLSIAAAFAEELECEAVLVGFNREEASTFPDNSEAFLDSVTHTFSFSTRNRVRVSCPTLHWSKREIVREAIRLKVPWNTIWSCYQSGDLLCGACESCQRYRRALLLNEVDCDAWFANSLDPQSHSI